MAASKPEMTWADYLAVGVAPVFIMALVGSLCFFLLDLGYAGEHAGRLRFALFWFVFGSVMLARVSITQGVAHAGLLGLGLGLATIAVLIAFVDQALIACLLVGVVWWCAHKLTWNCTFIDETVDPSAAGLLETAGADDRLAERRIGARSKAEQAPRPLADDDIRAEEAERWRHAPWWKRAWRSLTDLEPKAHAPGLSVLYFSLAALPLFGFGQWLIPAGAEDRQASAFRWLALYLASGLSLLLITSFLGLRRYLRRRTLEMPAAMTSSWIGVGGAMIAALLLGALVLPLPSARTDWAVALRDRVLTSPRREASRMAPLKSDGTPSDDPDAARTANGKQQPDSDTTSDDAGTPGEPNGAPGEQNESGQSGDEEKAAAEGQQQSADREPSNSHQDAAERSDGQQPADEEQQGNSSQSGGGSQSSGGSGDQQQSSQSGPSGEKSSPQPGNQGSVSSTPPPPTHPPASPANPLSSLAWLRPLFWIGLALVVLIAAIIYRRQVLALLREIADIWRGLWQIFFPRKARASTEEPPAPKPPFQPFARFANPFSDGRARQMSTDELVKYTFAALEAWAYEHGAAHRAEETPLEFTARIAAAFDALGPDATRLGGWLARSLYARQSPPRDALATLEALWRTMQSTPARTATELVET